MLESLCITGPLPANRIIGSYDPSLVALSYVIASLASFVALDMASQMGLNYSKREKHFWHIGGAVALGAGIWSMHFTGMLAYGMSLAHSYDFGITVLSLLMPIFFSYGVLHLIKEGSRGWRTIALAAPFLGLTIVAMHYTGMAAMRMDATLRYRPDWFLFSVVIAITASAGAIALLLRAADAKPGDALTFKSLSALIMGAAICGMHYAGMQAAVIVPHNTAVLDASNVTMDALLAVGIGTVTLLILGITLTALIINQKFAARLNQQIVKRTEELAAAKDAAEAANRTKSDFLANMSHEIRTPMNAMVGLTAVLARTEPLTERQRECIRTMEVSAAALMELLNDLLDISKIESNRVVLESIPFNIRQIADEAMAVVTLRAREKGLDLRLEMQPGLQQELVGDPVRLRQVLTNLVTNAIKFTSKGSVVLRVASRPIDQGTLLLTLDVIDTGIGIAPENLSNVFEKFTQAHAAINREFGGSGLGLAICRGLIAQMGGTISATSVPGQGSTFSVAVPVALNLSAKEPEKLPEDVIAFPKTKDRVLIVEDWQPNVLVAQLMLEMIGYGNAVARRGSEALEMFQNGFYSAILMDMQLPDMDGCETVRRLRQMEASLNRGRIPIIAATAYATHEDRSKCLAAGMDEYITKPLNPQQLEQILGELIRKMPLVHAG